MAAMTDIPTSVRSVFWQCDEQSELAKSLAKEYLQGCEDDYFFFQYDDDEYLLVISDSISFSQSAENYVFSAENPVCIQIIVDATNTSQSNNFRFTGRFSNDNANEFRGDLIQSNQVTSYSFRFRKYTPAIQTLTTSDILVYSSFSDTPHLLEGGDFYAFSTNVLLIIGFGFVLASRIFRRLY